MLFLLHQHAKVSHVLQLYRVSQLLVQSAVKTRFGGGGCTETIHFQLATVFRGQVIGPLKRTRGIFSQKLLRQSMWVNPQPIRQSEKSLLGWTRIRAPRGMVLTRFMRNLVAAIFPWAVTSSFNVNIIVTKSVFLNRSVYCENCVTTSPGWKLTVASIRSEFAAVVSLESNPCHSGHESMISNSTVISPSQYGISYMSSAPSFEKQGFHYRSRRRYTLHATFHRVRTRQSF
jgi:hypothetical protein